MRLEKEEERSRLSMLAADAAESRLAAAEREREVAERGREVAEGRAGEAEAALAGARRRVGELEEKGRELEGVVRSLAEAAVVQAEITGGYGGVLRRAAVLEGEVDVLRGVVEAREARIDVLEQTLLSFRVNASEVVESSYYDRRVEEGGVDQRVEEERERSGEEYEAFSEVGESGWEGEGEMAGNGEDDGDGDGDGDGHFRLFSSPGDVMYVYSYDDSVDYDHPVAPQ